MITTDLRLLVAVDYLSTEQAISITYDDGERVIITLTNLKVSTDLAVSHVTLDEFQRGIEVYFVDGTMHDVSIDYITQAAR